MAKTYLDIINAALLDANEVILNETTFLSAVGLQAFAKEAVNRSLVDIANECQEWEWLKADTVVSPTTVTTAASTQFYTFKTAPTLNDELQKVDFDTFFITDGADVHRKLTRITYDEWDNLFRELDERGAEGVPDYVIQLDEKNRFGLSPTPDDVYTISFNSWSNASFLSAALDPIPFPDQYYNVLVARVRYYLWDFKDDQNKASRADQEYRRGVAQMRVRLASPTPERMRFR